MRVIETGNEAEEAGSLYVLRTRTFVRDCVFENGPASDNVFATKAGFVLISESVCDIRDTTFSNSHRGCLETNQGSTLTLNNLTFRHCHSLTNGGGLRSGSLNTVYGNNLDFYECSSSGYGKKEKQYV